MDWTPPIDNGLLVSKYEVRFRFVEGCSSSVPCSIDGADLSSSTAKPGDEGFVIGYDICSPDNETFACTITSYTHYNLAPNRGYSYQARPRPAETPRVW